MLVKLRAAVSMAEPEGAEGEAELTGVGFKAAPPNRVSRGKMTEEKPLFQLTGGRRGQRAQEHILGSGLLRVKESIR